MDERAEKRPGRIALFTDFGAGGLYIGQVQVVLEAAGVPVIDLCNDAPVCNPRASAYLLSALANCLPGQTLFLCVVDPGVGSDRLPLLVRTEDHWFVGPDNGLFSQLIRREGVSIHSITWQPEQLSESFHGRDLFAPVACQLSRGEALQTSPLGVTGLVGTDWPEDLAEVIYVDCFGNLMTGIRRSRLPDTARLQVAGHNLSFARTFSEVALGEPFWYYNSIGLVELAVNGGRADQLLGLAVGAALAIIE